MKAERQPTAPPGCTHDHKNDMRKPKATDRKSGAAVRSSELVQHREELEMVKRVLTLVDGYVSTQPEDLLLAWDGGVMTWGELRIHLSAALKTKVLNSKLCGPAT